MSDMDDLRDSGFRVDGDFDYDFLDREAQESEVEVSDEFDYDYFLFEILNPAVGEIIHTLKNKPSVNRLLLKIDSYLLNNSLDKYYITIYYIDNISNKRIKIVELEETSLAICLDIAEDITQMIIEETAIKRVQRIYKKTPEIASLVEEIQKDRDRRYEDGKEKELLTCTKNNKYCYISNAPF